MCLLAHVGQVEELLADSDMISKAQEMDRVWGFNEGRPQHSRLAQILIELNLNNIIAVSFIDVSDE